MDHRYSLIRFLLQCQRRYSRSERYRHCRHFLCKHLSTTTLQSLDQPLSHATYVIWGSNTGVGKTLVSAGLAASTLLSSPSRFLYIKPFQTGFPSDSDSRFVFSKVCSLFARRSSPFTLCASNEVFNTSESAEDALEGSCNEDGGNGVQLSRWAEEKRVVGDENLVSELVCKTIYAWKEAVSPHLAVEREGGAVKDLEVLEMLHRCLRNGMEGEIGKGKLGVLSVIETSGGVASPGPSGSLQCDLYRPFRIPAILVGDGRLGGISGTISAYETLKLRGYDVIAIIMEDHGLANEFPLMNYTRNKVPVLVLPPIPKDLSDDLMGWFDRSHNTFYNLKGMMLLAYGERIQRLHDMSKKARNIFWWPFTQHQLVSEGAVTVIDSRHGENFAVLKDNKRIAPMFDACASWWTQGPDATMQIELARDMGYAAARFGHVMFPENVYEPALECAELLLEGVGKGWASRTYFSDNGSTAIEISLKMAFRKFCADHGIIPNSLNDSGSGRSSELLVLALQGSYHGDTLGAMEAQAPSSYTGFLQQPWYTGRGLFWDPATVFLHKKEWIISFPSGLQSETIKVKDITFASRDEIFHKRRDTSELAMVYSSYISKQLSESRGINLIGALLIEPVIQAAGGMHMVDPLFQRVLVTECRNRKIPVIFDEVFTGFWRLGVETAVELIHCVPDIACYGKLLTGGTIPLAATLATDAIFDSFMGDSKLKALLHGHSYSAHAMGCMAAAKSVKWFKDPCTNHNIISEKRILRELWDGKLVDQFSSHHAVRRVVALGTLFALELQAKGSNAGYGSLYARSLLQSLHQEGVYARPLGNVIYLMCGPCSSPETCRQLLIKLYRSLDEFAENHLTENLVICKAA